MEYKRATDILPDDLVRAIQEYTHGCVLYIPNKPGIRRRWGDATDAKTVIGERNERILDDYSSGLSIVKIAIKYHLAESTIKKIVYKK